MKLKLQERGQSLVLIALSVIALFGFSALAIDGSRVFSDRRNAQNAADTASLSAALAKIRGDSYADAAEDRAESNGYANDANSTVEVHLCNDPLITTACQGIPTSDPEPAKIIPANYIQVKITSILPATFARIIGRQEFENIVTAIAYAGPVEPQPLVKGNALAAMNPSEKDAIFGGGNMNLDVNNSGIFSNSTYQDALCNHGSMRTNGNGTYSVDTAIEVAGSFCPGNNTTISGPWELTGSIDYPPTINIQIPNISCSGSGSTSYDEVNFILTYRPGNYSNKIDPDGDAPPGKFVREAHFSPGNYCFEKGASFNGADIVANNVDFEVSGGDFKINGSTFTCNDMLVHVNGSGKGIDFTGTSNIYCNNVTFILSSGGATWNGAIENRMFAPTGGDYKCVLLYAPYPNSEAIKINGNATNQLTGSIIGVAAPITVTGNDWTTGLHSQIIGNTVNLNGNGTLVINYVPDEQYLQVDPSAIQLTK